MKNKIRRLKGKLLLIILSILCLYFGYLITPRKVKPIECFLYPIEIYQAKLYTLVKDMREEKVKWKIFFWPRNKSELPLCAGDPFPQ